MNKTPIEWTDYSWPIVNGCARVSAGCEGCYAERLIATRLKRHPKYAGLSEIRNGKPHWTGEVRPWPAALDEPLRLRKPSRIFVADMGDLFHEAVPDDFIDRVFAVMALCPQHTFQVLTKRPARMRPYMEGALERVACEMPTFGKVNGRPCPRPDLVPEHLQPRWPLPNVWLGTSVEDQARADERIPLLLETPAAVRFLSVEPMLGPVDLEEDEGNWIHVHPLPGPPADDDLPSEHGCFYGPKHNLPHHTRDTRCSVCEGQTVLDWVIVGGESGPRARPCELGWIRSIVEQCREAGVPCFVKQLGARPFEAHGQMDHCCDDAAKHPGRHPLTHRHADGIDRPLSSRKRGDPAEWPEDLRVREFPA